MLIINLRKKNLPTQEQFLLYHNGEERVKQEVGSWFHGENVFCWQPESAQWLRLESQQQAEALIQGWTEEAIYFWKDMPLLLPRTPLINSTLTAAQAIGKVAQDWLNQSLDMGKEVMTDFLNNVNSCSPPPDLIQFSAVQEGEKKTKREDPEWEKRWEDWAAVSMPRLGSSMPPLEPAPVPQKPEWNLPNVESLIQQHYEPKAEVDTESSFVVLPDDSQFDLAIASELQASAPPMSQAEDMERLCSSLSPAHQRFILDLRDMGFEYDKRLAAGHILERHPEVNDLDQLMDLLLAPYNGQ